METHETMEVMDETIEVMGWTIEVMYEGHGDL